MPSLIQAGYHPLDPARPTRPYMLGAVIAAVLCMAWYLHPTSLPGIYLLKQDVPAICAMAVAAMLFPYLSLGHRWEREFAPSGKTRLLAAIALIAVGIAGHWLVMLDYNVSRDETLAIFAAEQILRGSLVTPVPPEWHAFGRAIMPLFQEGRIDPGFALVSGYLPVNSAILALAARIVHPAIANPILLALGIAALWHVARRLWPERKDTAIVATLLAGTSSQLIATSMTSYAMTGHFALNMIWLALFLRRDWRGDIGALAIGFLTMGLHQLHFHLMFVIPFMLWLGARREWRSASLFGLGYAVFTVFWFKLYPGWLLDHVDSNAIVVRPAMGLVDALISKGARFFDYPPTLWLLNLVRFTAWQNMLLLPLALASWPVLKSRAGWRENPIFPLALGCALGLVLMVYQGHGWGYRYLSGVIGSFCLLAGAGWNRLVPVEGAGRHWTVLKAACIFTLAIQLPLLLSSARSFVAPYAKIYHAARASQADIVLVDTAGGFLPQDLAQNDADMEAAPKIVDLAYVPDDALVAACATRKVEIIDSAHYRASGMIDAPVSDDLRLHVEGKRSLLERLNCGTPLAL